MYHLHVKNISRGDGRSAVAAAAYRAGETLPNEKEEAESAFGGRRDVRHAEIRLPAHASAWMADRATLWNAVEAAEKRKDARLAKEIEFALPRELPRAAWLEVARAMADAYTARGHVVDLAIHDDDTAHNPHVHLMLTTRAIIGDGFGGKLREADGIAFVREARALWERIANAALGKAGSAVMIDARSYAARGMAKVPGQHRGPDAAARRTRRREVARMAGPLDQDILEARRELLIERRTRERFPHLAARPDWPPEGRQPLRGMMPAEREELRRFWREVDRRVFGEPEREEEPEREQYVPPRPREPESRMTHRQVQRDAEVRTGLLEAAMPTWRELHAAVEERMRAAGIEPGPLSDWSRVQEAMERFESQLSAARALDAENRELADRWRAWEAEQEKMRSVPDPSGDVIAQQDLDQAEERMIAAMQAPDHGEAAAGSAAERRAAEQALMRQAEIPVSDREAAAFRLAPQENRLDWLDGRAAGAPTVPVERESRDDRLDWLREQPEPAREQEERDRDRQR